MQRCRKEALAELDILACCELDHVGHSGPYLEEQLERQTPEGRVRQGVRPARSLDVPNRGRCEVDKGDEAQDLQGELDDVEDILFRG